MTPQAIQEFQTVTSRGLALRVWRVGQAPVETVPVFVGGVHAIDIESVSAATAEDLREAAAAALSKAVAYRSVEGVPSVVLDLDLVSPVVP